MDLDVDLRGILARRSAEADRMPNARQYEPLMLSSLGIADWPISRSSHRLRLSVHPQIIRGGYATFTVVIPILCAETPWLMKRSFQGCGKFR